MRLLEEVVKESSESLWKKLGEKALTKAVTTLVGEIVKAGVDIKKRQKLREDKAAFDANNKKKKSNKKSKKKSSDESDDEATSSDDENDELDEEGEEAADKEKDRKSTKILSFDQYLNSRGI